MAVPKDKLAILIAGLKPKGAHGDEEEGSSSYDDELDRCIDDLADAIVGGDKDGIKHGLHALHDCMVEEDEEQDSDEEPKSKPY